MRWEQQEVDAEDGDALPGLGRIRGVLRTVSPKDMPGVRFHEVAARSALNAVPGSSPMPFRWTINPYRGCTHACVYCYARGTHSWLELDTGTGFDREIVVKVNVAEVLAREVVRPTWTREHVALGTNTDPYQRAEGRYALMPGIIKALAGSGTPFSILTKGTLLRRDLPLLRDAAADVPIGLGVSLAIHDDDLHAALEPGTPDPRARLALVRAMRDAGLPCGVMLAPVLPWLTDTEEHLDKALSCAQGRRRHRRDGAGAAPAGPAPGSGSSPGWPANGRTWSSATRRSTRAAPTSLAPTDGPSPPGCSRSSSDTASPGSVAARCGASPATRTPSSRRAACLRQPTYQPTRRQLSSRS